MMHPPVDPHDVEDATDLTHFGYAQSLKRTMGPLASFALAFSMISISTATFFAFSNFFTTVGGIGIWLWIPVAIGVLLIVLVYAHLAARIPITGYAYQWNSRLVSPHYGWFSGWTALIAFFAGTASIGMALASIFGPEIWAKPTAWQTIELAGVCILVAAILNIISIRATSLINNIGVGFEIVGSLGAAAILFVGAAFFFHHSEGVGVLFQVGPSDGSKLTWMSLSGAVLLPVYTLLGWEGSADLAEETKDPRRVTPYAMIRANYVSVIASLIMIAGFMVAIPHGLAALVKQPENPLLYIFRSQLGNVATEILEVIVFIAIFSCLLANMAVGVRLCYSLARDGMLPGSSVLSRVGHKTGTPIWCVVVVAVLAFSVNLLSAGIANNVVSIVNVVYYATYALTAVAVLIGLKRKVLPEGLPGGFTLGRWLVPITILALIFAVIIILDMTLPEADHVAAEYAIGAEVLGALWYLFYLRPRLNAGRVGPAMSPVGADGVLAAAD